MTRDDRLAAAARALREQTDPTPASVLATRTRILAQAASLRQKRRNVVRYLLPLAATLVLATAWASTHGGLPSVLREMTGTMHATHDERSAASLGSSAATTDPIAPPPAESPAAVPVDSLPASSASPPPASAHASARASASASAPAPDPALDLYAAAHEAHFVQREPAAALRAWDAYLAAAPTGRFVPEAKYNRALCLIRLGRTDDARAALRPFAEGAYGSYRAREAAEILRALEDDTADE